jgi:hypothetical protein
MPLIPAGHIITILDVNDNTLFTATCAAVIPFRYRDKMVSSVVQETAGVTIKLYVIEVKG